MRARPFLHDEDARAASSTESYLQQCVCGRRDNEDFQPILQDAILRFVRPGGAILPRTTSSYLVPVAARRAHADLSAGAVANLTPRYEIGALYRQKGIRSPFNLYYDCIVPRSSYLSRPELLRSYRGAWDQPATYAHALSFSIHRSEKLTGFKAYFVGEFTESTSLDISGDDIAGGETSDSWKHAYLPIEQPIDVREGDRLEVLFQRLVPTVGSGPAPAFRQVYRWSGRVLCGQTVVGSFAQAMDATP